MNKTIINLPVKDLAISRSFFTKLGLSIDEEMSDENALCITLNDYTTVALLPKQHFAEATKGAVADSSSTHEVLLSLGMGSEEQIDSMIKVALEQGASEVHDPVRVESMYGRTFTDLDGHQWNLFYES